MKSLAQNVTPPRSRPLKSVCFDDTNFDDTNFNDTNISHDPVKFVYRGFSVSAIHSTCEVPPQAMNAACFYWVSSTIALFSAPVGHYPSACNQHSNYLFLAARLTTLLITLEEAGNLKTLPVYKMCCGHKKRWLAVATLIFVYVVISVILLFHSLGSASRKQGKTGCHGAVQCNVHKMLQCAQV